MATEAIGGGRLIASAHMAGCAGDGAVEAGEGESGEAVVVKARGLPGFDVMTVLASGRKTGCTVIDDLGALILRQVAGFAACAESDVDSGGGSAMAGIALSSGMRAQQGEAIPVVAHGLGGYSPAANGVAVLALRAELALMKIGVAVRAGSGGVGEVL